MNPLNPKIWPSWIGSMWTIVVLVLVHNIIIFYIPSASWRSGLGVLVGLFIGAWTLHNLHLWADQVEPEKGS